MRTTEVFVEQVLIGLLVLATGFLPYIEWDQIITGWSAVGLGGGIVAVSYLLGIVLDRIADTLLSRPEQYHRLNFTIEVEEGKHDLKPYDLFPEDNLMYKILEKSGARDRAEYLRSRIRLSRAIAVFVPALTLSGLLSLGSERDNISCCQVSSIPFYLKPPFIMGVTASIYLLCLLVLIISKVKGWKVLKKTWAVNAKSDITNFSWWWEPTIIASYLLIPMAFFVAVYFICNGYSTPSRTLTVLFSGLVISALSAWAWWRINQTYMKLLYNWKEKGSGKE